MIKFFLFILCSFSSVLSAACTCAAPLNHTRLMDNWVYHNQEHSKKVREVLITGCARSGTTFVTQFFRKQGYDVNHEHDAQFGIVSWTMAVDSPHSAWGPSSNQYYFKHIFHQVRHPLKTIASVMATENERSWKFICGEVPDIKMSDHPMVKAAKYWYYWNLKAESKAELTYRIEDITLLVPRFSAILGVPLDVNTLSTISTRINHRAPTRKLTWVDLRKALNQKMFDKVVCLAKRYGYDVSQAMQHTQKVGN